MKFLFRVERRKKEAHKKVKGINKVQDEETGKQRTNI